MALAVAIQLNNRMTSMTSELTIPDTTFDGTCETAIQALEFVLDEVDEVLKTSSPTPQDQKYLKSCICVETRTAFSVLKDFVRWEARSRMTEEQLLQFAQRFDEYHAVKRGFERAVELLTKLGAVEGQDPFLDSVMTKLGKMSG